MHNTSRPLIVRGHKRNRQVRQHQPAVSIEFFYEDTLSHYQTICSNKSMNAQNNKIQ